MSEFDSLGAVLPNAEVAAQLAHYQAQPQTHAVDLAQVLAPRDGVGADFNQQVNQMMHTIDRLDPASPNAWVHMVELDMWLKSTHMYTELAIGIGKGLEQSLQTLLRVQG